MTTPIRSGIPTTYSASNFRSRLEARWAAFFDLIGWQWVYEPLDCNGYIPDFLIQGPHPFFVEVGPCITPGDYAAKSNKPESVADELRHDILIVGVSPIVTIDEDHDGPQAGYLGEAYIGWSGCVASPNGLDWGAARWALCEHGIGVTHTCGDWGQRPLCDCRERWPIRRDAMLFTQDLDRLWREAGNRVQWKAA